jgi:AcrR family transcriptional regulator
MARKATTRSKRLPLTRERVLAAAVRLADEGGLESLTMRKLARELGVEAMSLYNHVENKDDLVAGMIDAVASEVDLPSDAADWKTAIRRSSISRGEAVLRHRWAAEVWRTRGGGPARMRHGDWLLRALREGGLSDDLIYHAFHVLESYVLGYTLMQLNFPHQGEELAGMAKRFLQRFPTEEYPDLAEHIRQHVEPDHGDRSGFELGLDLILDGLERARG